MQHYKPKDTTLEDEERRKKHAYWYYKCLVNECPGYFDRVANASKQSNQDKKEIGND